LLQLHNGGLVADDVLLIKKYANRRLYDTEQSRYITLDELAATVRGGRRVQIIEAKEGADLTRAVLLQVILEEQDRLDMLPVGLLHQLIRAQGTMQQAPLTGFLKMTYEQWAHAGEAVAKQFVPGRNPDGAAQDPLSAMMKTWASHMPKGAAPWFGGASAPKTPDPEPAAPKSEPAPKAEDKGGLAAEAQALRKQMEELLKRLDAK
jgi:polyhydroxyalkanoate synthesis repressor PhaR